MSLAETAAKALEESEFYTRNSYKKGKYYGNLICPECGKANAWAHRKKPFSIICNNQNSCGAKTKTIPLFNLSSKIEEQFKPTKEEPDRPATEFLRLRGIPDDLIKKVEYKYISKTRKDCGGMVGFPLELPKTGKKLLYTGRLINPPKGQGKTHNTGRLDGKHWQLPDSEYNLDEPVFVTEGVIDALSLIAIGKQAIALVAAGTTPKSKNFTGTFRNLVFALDNDKAGAGYTKKWMKHCESNKIEATAIMPRYGDWNDLLSNAGSVEIAKKRFASDYEKYQLQANLSLAKTAKDYAHIYFAGNEQRSPGLFSFNGCYHYATTTSTQMDDGKGGKKTVWMIDKVKRASNFLIKVEHYQRSDQDKELPVFHYRLKIIPKKGRPVTATATGNDLKSPDSLTGFFLRHGKANWKGQADAAKAFSEKVTSSKAPVIRQAEFAGYDHATGYHVLKDIAISPKGEIVHPEPGGYFKIGYGQYLRPFHTETIKPKHCDIPKLFSLMVQAWGERAAAAVSFLVASMFVNQVKPETKFFPFLSMYGDPQTGKSRLLILLNAMQGLDEEGLPMSGGNTKKGEIRTLAQVSGIMKGMIEGNDHRKTQFDFESILPLYNIGNPLQMRAAFSNDNRVLRMEFHGSLAFVQNKEPFTSRAAKERVISLKFSTDDVNEQTKTAYEGLIEIPIQELAGFLDVLKSRPFFVEGWQDAFKQAKADLGSSVPDNRINENHGLLLAFNRLFCELFKIDYDLQPYLEKIGKEKMVSCKQRPLTPADYFFDALDTLPDEITDERGDAHSLKNSFFHVKDGRAYINKPRAERAIRANGMMLDYPEKLGSSLQDHPATIETNKNHRYPAGNQGRSFVFDVERMGA